METNSEMLKQVVSLAIASTLIQPTGFLMVPPNGMFVGELYDLTSRRGICRCAKLALTIG